jgi:predicted ester cyclase
VHCAGLRGALGEASAVAYITQNPLATGLIAIGKTAIAKEDDAALRAYFAPGYILHLPGADIDFMTLRAYFASLRDAFDDFTVTRAFIIGEDRYLAARTIFSGTFARPFMHAIAGELPPTGKFIEWQVMNIFRYDAADKLAEEWVQNDSRIFLEKLTSVA